MVEALADRRHGLGVRVIEGEAGGGRGGAGREQAHGVCLFQRYDGLDHLAGDGERFLTGRQQAYPGGVAQQARGQLGDFVHDMLAVVEQQEETPVAQEGCEAVEGGARADVVAETERGGDGRGEGVLSGGERGEFDEPDAVGEGVDGVPGVIAACAGGRCGQREARLPDPAGTDQRDQPGGVEEPAHAGDGGIASDRGVQVHGQVGGGASGGGDRCGGGGEFGGSDQDRLVQRGDGVAGVEAEFVGEASAQILVRGQGVCLAARPVERPHLRGPQALAQRVCGDEVRDFVGDEGVLAEVEAKFGEVFDGGQTLLLQAGHGRARELGVPEIGERGPAPQREGVGQQSDACSGLGLSAGPRHQRREPRGIDGVVLDLEQVSGR